MGFANWFDFSKKVNASFTFFLIHKICALLRHKVLTTEGGATVTRFSDIFKDWLELFVRLGQLVVSSQHIGLIYCFEHVLYLILIGASFFRGCCIRTCCKKIFKPSTITMRLDFSWRLFALISSGLASGFPRLPIIFNSCCNCISSLSASSTGMAKIGPESVFCTLSLSSKGVCSIVSVMFTCDLVYAIARALSSFANSAGETLRPLAILPDNFSVLPALLFSSVSREDAVSRCDNLQGGKFITSSVTVVIRKFDFNNRYSDVLPSNRILEMVKSSTEYHFRGICRTPYKRQLSCNLASGMVPATAYLCPFKSGTHGSMSPGSSHDPPSRGAMT